MESMKPGCRHSCVQEVQAAQGKACKLFATGLSCQKFDSPEREDAAMCSPLRPCGTLTVASRGTVVVASSVQSIASPLYAQIAKAILASSVVMRLCTEGRSVWLCTERRSVWLCTERRSVWLCTERRSDGDDETRCRLKVNAGRGMNVRICTKAHCSNAACGTSSSSSSRQPPPTSYTCS